jgi:hypothetical protein
MNEEDAENAEKDDIVVGISPIIDTFINDLLQCSEFGYIKQPNEKSKPRWFDWHTNKSYP